MKTLFILIIVSLLTACATPAPLIVYKSTVVAPEDALLLDCLVEPPPNKEAYKAATMKEREIMLLEMIEKQYKNTFACNIRWRELREWKVKTKAVYEEKNKDASK